MKDRIQLWLAFSIFVPMKFMLALGDWAEGRPWREAWKWAGERK